jgi:hypothetical protein
MPAVPGMGGGRLTTEVGVTPWRTKQDQRLVPFKATSSKRGTVRPTNGSVCETLTGVSDGHDDGTDYFSEYRTAMAESHADLPACKTRKQDDLAATLRLLDAGVTLPEQTIEDAKRLIALIQATDEEHGRAWRQAAGEIGLYVN